MEILLRSCQTSMGSAVLVLRAVSALACGNRVLQNGLLGKGILG